MDARQENASEAAQTAENESTRQEETPPSGMAASGDGASEQQESEQEDSEGGSTETEVKLESVLTQKELEELAASERGKKATELIIDAEYEDENPPVIDFGAVSFPKLESLHVSCQAVKALNFKAKDYPRLRSLEMENLIGELEFIDFHLPSLKTANFQFVHVVDSSGFGKSLSRSPKLTFFYSYKLWGLHCRGGHTLVLPRCENLDLYRSDDLNKVKLWAPRLQNLNLQACYGLTAFSILNTKPSGYSSKEYEFHGQPSNYTVNVLNIGELPGGNVLTHPRCSGVSGITDDDDDFGFGW